MNINERVAHVVRTSSMSQSEIARACSVSPASVNQWLNGDTKAPTAEKVFALSAATGVSAEWIVTGKGAMKADREPDDSIDKVLAQLMKERALSQAQLELKTGVTQSTISRILNPDAPKGIKVPSETQVKPLADFFGVTVSQLRGYDPIGGPEDAIRPPCESDEKIYARMQLAKRVTTAIKKSSMSKVRIAEELGVSAQAITGWEKTGRIDKAHLVTLAELAGVNLNWLISGEVGEDDFADSVGERVRLARKNAGLSQSELAETAGIKQGSLSELERGLSRSSAYLAQIAAASGVTAEWLATGKGVAPKPVTAQDQAPLLAWNQLSRWQDSSLDLDDHKRFLPDPSKGSSRTFALKIEGESMLEDYSPGTIIFVDPQRQPSSGDDVVVFLDASNQGVVLRRYINESGVGEYLKTLNPILDDPGYTRLDEGCEIVGVVTADVRLR